MQLSVVRFSLVSSVQCSLCSLGQLNIWVCVVLSVVQLRASSFKLSFFGNNVSASRMQCRKEYCLLVQYCSVSVVQCSAVQWSVGQHNMFCLCCVQCCLVKGITLATLHPLKLSYVEGQVHGPNNYTLYIRCMDGCKQIQLLHISSNCTACMHNMHLMYVLGI